MLWFQTVLPGNPINEKVERASGSKVYDKDLVRTDSRNQKIDKFLSSTLESVPPSQEPEQSFEESFVNQPLVKPQQSAGREQNACTADVPFKETANQMREVSNVKTNNQPNRLINQSINQPTDNCNKEVNAGIIILS